MTILSKKVYIYLKIDKVNYLNKNDIIFEIKQKTYYKMDSEPRWLDI